MGITAQSLRLIEPFTHEFKTMCELGSQQMYYCDGVPFGTYAKDILSRDWEHVSIDLDGKGGSLILDLNKDIDIGKFDVVTNFGTLEHVEDLYMGFKNMHNLCRLHGVMIHVFPSKGHWMNPLHGNWRVEKSLFQNLGYQVLMITEEKTFYGGDDSYQIYTVLAKVNDVGFMIREEFEKLGIIKIGNEKYKEGVGLV